MTTTLAAPTVTWQPVCAQPVASVLTISNMPVQLRPHVEELMAEYLSPAESEPFPGADIWDMQWFTRWQPDRTTFGARAVRCREVITASRDETERFGHALESLACAHGFDASVERA
ncbi:hypothetical protein [Corynebacterium lubricantis]|uniref:hypothetical protein n=1 Tax=Corynebacterium lubricantis TaxID=541095 RepID=UPI0003770199|nr:hypothetical protein [Corynebacterium lubricantis]